MAAEDGRYVTLDDVKGWLGLPLTPDATKDPILARLIKTVEKKIDVWTASVFDEPVVVATPPEIQDARRQDIIIPRGYPIISIQALKFGVNADGSGGMEIPATEYNFDEVEIRLRAEGNMPLARGYISIAYTWGYDEVPPDVEQATLIGVEGYYRMRARQSVGVTSKAKEGESVSYKGTWDQEAGLPVEAVGLLSDYRRIEWPDGAGGQMATRNR